jgi:acyl-CoA synthetase (AMP-forming)/AMP-acid ligase II
VLAKLHRDPQAAAIISVIDGDTETWTCSDLLRMTSGATAFLDENGAAEGEYVPALLTTRPISVAMLMAGAFSGRPLAPLGPRMTERELLSCLDRLDGDLLLAEPDWADKAAQLAARTGRRVAVLDGLAPRERQLDVRTDPDDVVFMMHTSGTTGLPKQIPVRESALGHRAEVNGAVLGLEPGSRLVIAGLFHHVGGLGNIAVTLANDAAMVLFPAFSVPAWRSLEAVAPTHTITVPSVIEMLLAAGALKLPTMKVFCYGGSPIHPDTMRRIQDAMPDVDFVELFGQTEGSPLTVLTPDDHRAAAGGREELLKSVGRAAPGVELHIHDPDSAGAGEVWARCSHSFLVDDQGWQHTGDIGYLVDGYLYLAGRKGDKIIRGGENVFPLEVEQILESHPDVAEAAVVGVPDQRLGEAIRAYVVATDPEMLPDTDDLRAYCRQRLAGFKVPAQWAFVSALPRNPVGKLLRKQLADGSDPAALV